MTEEVIVFKKNRESKSNGKDILIDLRDLSLSESIKGEVTNFFRKYNIITRGEKRRKLLFAVTYYFYLLHGINNIHEIASIFGIKDKKIAKTLRALNTIKGFEDHLGIQVTIVSPEEVINNYCHKLGIEGESIEAATHFFNDQILSLDPNLDDENPSIVGLASLLYYLELQGVELTEEFNDDFFRRNKKKVFQMRERIERIYNRHS